MVLFCFRTMLSLLTMPISQKDNSPGCHIYHKSHVTIHHKDVQVQKHMKTFNQIHPTTIYITGGELFRFSSGLRPLLTILHYVLTARVFKCPKYGKMDTIHVNVNVETSCFYESFNIRLI